MPPKYMDNWYGYLERAGAIITEKKRTPYNTMYLGISKFYEPEKILVNGPATIVFWKDGTKTVVKLSEGDHYDEYTAYCIALTKKICGSNSKIKSIIKRTIKFGDAYTVLDSLIGKINELDNAINGGVNNG